MGPLLSPSLCCCVTYVFWIFSEIAHFSISSFWMRFDFCGHISSSFVKRNQRRVTPQTSDWLKKEKRSRGEGEGARWQVAGAQGGTLASPFRGSLGVCEGGNYLMARTCRTLLGGNHALNVAVARSSLPLSLSPSTSAAAAAAGSCVKFFLLFNLIRIPTFYWRL